LFTGLVECVGTVRSIAPGDDGVSRIGIRAPVIAPGLRRGESVSVSGACLTVVEPGGEVFYAQMMRETLLATRLGRLKPGDGVNLERALRLGDRLDGHLVLGHVDGVGAVSRVENQGSAAKVWFSIPPEIAWGVAPKGSIAIDGVSLTVIDAQAECFSVGLIPTTLGDTTIGSLEQGDAVNLEIDVMARYAARLLGRDWDATRRESLSWEKLREYGWA